MGKIREFQVRTNGCTENTSIEKTFLGKQIPQDMLDLAERTETRYEVVEKIIDLGQDHDGLFFQVQ